ncbi:hypothetical protein L861_00470 [Litchfieldella anticariensis FP35 = DSM 16096]|uniref:dTTP/UTP pyrophosphatase n=1 Tax=Litchfieldella anticariensis (strain DSM 16096 / CECT 5854 / CIP 108499 / LMG 22089 / FP35) TaxID=1121939 RepID=S2KTE7_LITA3|nr:Maf family protein [Halomonas anticariensis]EPC03803.1 hypothetical protein L861_00470 [Halomonas anticariensis FP35 = DSM 16096]
MTITAKLCLASASPRRLELLSSIGVVVETRPVDIDESLRHGETPSEYVARLARGKALAGACLSTLPVLGADTVVVHQGRVLGKPQNREHAREMLTALSGTSHEVLTAVALSGPVGLLERCVTTRVCMREIQEREIAAYWATGEPEDKAGGYAIQGLAAIFVERIEGSHSAVVGLPLFETAELLQRQGVPLWTAMS